MPPTEEIRFPLDLFQVVRGSILIKNAIDTTGGARVVDVVEQDGEGDIDPDTNVFGRYYQNKENPMYSSDEDLRPKFTEIFRQDETDFTESIPVHKGKNLNESK